jgi:magnesium chelatase accessory protein
MFDSLYPTMQWAQYANRWPHAACSQFVQAGGIRWHVQTMGSGPCLLLLHGTGSGSFSWRGLMPLLSPHFKIIAPDLPGHAFTNRGPEGSLSLNGMTEGIRALMLQLNLTPAIIAGHSAGAAIAANFILQQRSLQATRLIGLNPAWLPLPGLPSWIFGPAAKLAALNPLSAWATAKFAKRQSTIDKSIAQTGSKLDAEGMALYQEVFSHSGHVHSVLNMMAAWQLLPLASALHTIHNPVDLLVGLEDGTVPPSMADEAIKIMPQARIHFQQKLGHLAHEEDPAGTASLMLQICGVAA